MKFNAEVFKQSMEDHTNWAASACFWQSQYKMWKECNKPEEAARCLQNKKTRLSWAAKEKRIMREQCARGRAD